jgi:hypothetical protein
MAIRKWYAYSTKMSKNGNTILCASTGVAKTVTIAGVQMEEAGGDFAVSIFRGNQLAILTKGVEVGDFDTVEENIKGKMYTKLVL